MQSAENPWNAVLENELKLNANKQGKMQHIQHNVLAMQHNTAKC